jgi:hypothetical protein
VVYYTTRRDKLPYFTVKFAQRMNEESALGATPAFVGFRPNHKSGHMHTILNFIAAQNKAGHLMHIQSLRSVIATHRSSSQNSERAENDDDDDNNNREFV